MKLFRLLKSLNKLSPKPDEVIIIDDKSIDQTPALLRKWENIENGYNKVIILKKQNLGPAHSRNLGIKKTSHDLVAFLDDDVVVKSDWIKRISTPLTNGNSCLVGMSNPLRNTL